MVKESNNSNVKLVIVLLVIIIILLLGIIVFFLKEEYFDDRDRDKQTIIDNTYDDYDNDYEDDIKDDNRDNYNNTGKYITRDDALEVALNSLKIAKSDIYDLSSELNYKYGATVYEIEFKYNRYEYEFYIDVESGKILKSFRERD